MTEQNSTDFNVPQTRSLVDQAAPMSAQSVSQVVPENPTGDLQVKTPLDYMRDAYAKEIENDPITLKIPNREGMGIEFDTNITSEQIDLWRKQSTVGNRRQRRGGGEGEMDQLKFMALVIISQTRYFKWHGEDVYLDPPVNNKPVTFYEEEALKQIVESNATTNVELVKHVYRNDAHLISVGSQIIEAAGYGDDVDEVEVSPTSR